jgi:hypothetical protein
MEAELVELDEGRKLIMDQYKERTAITKAEVGTFSYPTPSLVV